MEKARMKPARLLIILWALLIAVALTAQIPEPVNIEAIEKIKTEARSRRSQVKDVARALTNVYGARLTNSPNIKAAGEYARKKLMEWRLDDVHLEPWSFGNGWTNEKFSLKLVSDPSFSLVAYPKAWTPGTSDRSPPKPLKPSFRTKPTSTDSAVSCAANSHSSCQFHRHDRR